MKDKKTTDLENKLSKILWKHTDSIAGKIETGVNNSKLIQMEIAIPHGEIMTLFKQYVRELLPEKKEYSHYGNGTQENPLGCGCCACEEVRSHNQTIDDIEEKLK